MNENKILATILASGKVKNFGSDMSVISLVDKTILEHTITKVQKKFSEISITKNNTG